MCDDIALVLADTKIAQAEHACELGQRWFFDAPEAHAPRCTIAGQPAALADGIQHAAKLLTAARYPLIYGLRHASCEAQQVAASLADWLGACIDTPTSSHHGPWGVSFQGVGEVTSSLGEVANRGDLLIFWGVDPITTHPRHFERYSVEPKGMFVPRGRADRTLVVVDIERTPTADAADLFLQVTPGRDFEALWTLRALIAEHEPDAAQVLADTGLPLATWQALVERMKQARFGVMFFGTGLALTRGRHLNTEALLAVVRDMNAHTRFVAKAMRAGGNVAGADNVLAWRTGYAFGVNLAQGYPRFNPGEYTANEILLRREADAVLLVGCDLDEDLAPAARQELAGVPHIVLGHRPTSEAAGADVAFQTSTPGIHTGGTAYRMDEIPLPLRPAVASPLPRELEVLEAIERRVRELQAEVEA
jgi:formylmethanofuran dehydrogenase subunit B